MKRALITGVSGGLGAAMAREFRRHGWFVTGVCRTAPAGDVCDEFIICDLTDPVAVSRLAESVGTLAATCGLCDTNAENQTPL